MLGMILLFVSFVLSTFVCVNSTLSGLYEGTRCVVFDFGNIGWSRTIQLRGIWNYQNLIFDTNANNSSFMFVERTSLEVVSLDSQWLAHLGNYKVEMLVLLFDVTSPKLNLMIQLQLSSLFKSLTAQQIPDVILYSHINIQYLTLPHSYTLISNNIEWFPLKAMILTEYYKTQWENESKILSINELSSQIISNKLNNKILIVNSVNECSNAASSKQWRKEPIGYSGRKEPIGYSGRKEPIGYSVHNNDEMHSSGFEIQVIKDVLPTPALELLRDRLSHVHESHAGTTSFYISFQQQYARTSIEYVILNMIVPQLFGSVKQAIERGILGAEWWIQTRNSDNPKEYHMDTAITWCRDNGWDATLLPACHFYPSIGSVYYLDDYGGATGTI